jgi:hypothetical protein
MVSTLSRGRYLILGILIAGCGGGQTTAPEAPQPSKVIGSWVVQFRQLTPESGDEPCTAGSIQLNVRSQDGQLVGSHSGFQGYCESEDQTGYDQVIFPPGDLIGTAGAEADSIDVVFTLGVPEAGSMSGVLSESLMEGSATLTLSKTNGDSVNVHGLWRAFH